MLTLQHLKVLAPCLPQRQLIAPVANIALHRLRDLRLGHIRDFRLRDLRLCRDIDVGPPAARLDLDVALAKWLRRDWDHGLGDDWWHGRDDDRWDDGLGDLGIGVALRVAAPAGGFDAVFVGAGQDLVVLAPREADEAAWIADVTLAEWLWRDWDNGLGDDWRGGDVDVWFPATLFDFDFDGAFGAAAGSGGGDTVVGAGLDLVVLAPCDACGSLVIVRMLIMSRY
tara:strand:+ start:5937 stop:6614 length:678 start_codon:yes stop_codon:yes gene_type:complete